MSWNDLRKGRYSKLHFEYLITFNTLNRTPDFLDFELAHLFCQQIKRNQQLHQCTWLAWVLMPDHFHGLVRLDGESAQLSSIVRHLKGSSSNVINKYLNASGSLWQPSFHDHALRAEEDRLKVARYIVANPLRKGLVRNVQEYPYWDSVYL